MILIEPADTDVPSPIDLRQMADAREWAATALQKRPCRPEFFDLIAAQIAAMSVSAPRLLELGSGPGFLAQHLLQRLPQLDYTLLDFSGAMHRLAQERLGSLATQATFIERSFKDAGWSDGLGAFDVIVTHQAIHELRHKRHASSLHREVRALLKAGGIYLVSDHHAGEGGMQNKDLYMTVDEQIQALHAAGFLHVELLLRKGGMALHRATMNVEVSSNE